MSYHCYTYTEKYQECLLTHWSKSHFSLQPTFYNCFLPLLLIVVFFFHLRTQLRLQNIFYTLWVIPLTNFANFETSSARRISVVNAYLYCCYLSSPLKHTTLHTIAWTIATSQNHNSTFKNILFLVSDLNYDRLRITTAIITFEREGHALVFFFIYRASVFWKPPHSSVDGYNPGRTYALSCR